MFLNREVTGGYGYTDMQVLVLRISKNIQKHAIFSNSSKICMEAEKRTTQRKTQAKHY